MAGFHLLIHPDHFEPWTLPCDRGKVCTFIAYEGPMTTPMRVLLADDDLNICRTLGLSLKSFHCSVAQAHSVVEAQEILQSKTFDLILTDFRMGTKTGADLIREARKKDPKALVA